MSTNSKKEKKKVHQILKLRTYKKKNQRMKNCLKRYMYKENDRH